MDSLTISTLRAIWLAFANEMWVRFLTCTLQYSRFPYLRFSSIQAGSHSISLDSWRTMMRTILLTHNRHTVWMSISYYPTSPNWGKIIRICVFYIIHIFWLFQSKDLKLYSNRIIFNISKQDLSILQCSQNRVWNLGGKARTKSSVPGIKAIVGQLRETFSSVTWVVFDTYLIWSLVIKVCQITSNSYWRYTFKIGAKAP